MIVMNHMARKPRGPSFTTICAEAFYRSRFFKTHFSSTRCSYFVEIFKTHGPLHPRDPILVGSLELVPAEKRELIDLSGGLEKFLLEMPVLVLVGENLVLKEEQLLVSETIHSSHNSFPSLQDLTDQNYAGRVGKQINSLPRVVMGGAGGWTSQQTSGLEFGAPIDYSPAKNMQQQERDRPQLSSSSASSLYTGRDVQPQGFGGGGALPARSSSSLSLPGSTSPVIPPRPVSADLPKTDNNSKKTKKNGGSASSLSSSFAAKVNEPERGGQSLQQQQQLYATKPRDPETEKAGSGRVEATRNKAKTENHNKPPDKGGDSLHNPLFPAPNFTPHGKECVDVGGFPGVQLNPGHSAEGNDGKKEGVRMSSKGLKTGQLSNQGSKSSSNSASEDEAKGKPHNVPSKVTISSRQKDREKENLLPFGKGTSSARTEKKSRGNGSGAVGTSLVDMLLSKKVGLVDAVVQTDPLPEVETFKDRYEELLEERASLISKLEESEDRRVQLQRSQTLEMEKACKKIEQEVRKVSWQAFLCVCVCVCVCVCTCLRV